MVKLAAGNPGLSDGQVPVPAGHDAVKYEAIMIAYEKQNPEKYNAKDQYGLSKKDRMEKKLADMKKLTS